MPLSLLFLPPLDSLSPIPLDRPPTILLFIFPHSLGFHSSRDDLFSHVLLDFLRAIIFPPSHLPSPRSRPPPRLPQHPRALQRASDLTLSSYVSSILYPRHLSSRRPRALLTVRRTLESHKALRRIFHAAISTSRDERRYSSRRPIRPGKNGGDLV